MRINFNLGGNVEIYEKVESLDNEGNPKYDWNLKTTEKAFFIKMGRDRGLMMEGMPDLSRHALLIFSPDSVISEEHRVKYQNKVYRVIGIRDVEYKGKKIYKEAEVELVEN